MYTIEQILKMYDSKNQEVYKNKVEEYLNHYTEVFKDEEDSSGVELIAEDSEVMHSVLESLEEGDTDEALESIRTLDTLVREYLLGFIIDIKEAE